MLVTLLVLLLTGEALCQSQYITHPLGAISYISRSHFQQAGYSYVTPTGQTVNVKFATSASVKPQTSAVPRFNAPRFVFHSAPVALPLTANPEPDFSLFQPHQAQPGFFQEGFRPARPAALRPAAPRPESLFVPSIGVGPAQSEKQLQAYKDYLKELAQEDARAVTEAQAPVPDEYEPESLSYIDVDIGEK